MIYLAKSKRLFKFALENKKKTIGVWCNGNTTDSGPVFPGSSPGTPTTNASMTYCSHGCVCCWGYHVYVKSFVVYV